MFDLYNNLISPFLVEWYIDIYKSTYGADTTYSDIILKFNSYLKMMINSTIFTVFSNIILTIGIVLVMFHFFSDIAEKAVDKQISTLMIGKSFGALFLTIFVLFHTKELFIFMLKMVESLNGELSVANKGTLAVSLFLSNETVQLLMSRCVAEYFSLWDILGYAITAIIIMLVSFGVQLYITYYAATRIIQLFVYYVFAPIGMSDMFENAPGGTINFHSPGMRYAKTILAIMLQLIVITVISQTFPIIAANVNAGYFKDHGDSTLSGTAENQASTSIVYPLTKMEYTDHYAPIRDLVIDGKNKISESLKKLSSAMGDDDNSDVESDETTTQKEKLKDSEIHKVTKVIRLSGKPNGSEGKKMVKEIEENSKYRMTIESTELFFNWCTGADGGKISLFIILMIVKVLMVFTSTKICNYITGVSI